MSPRHRHITVITVLSLAIVSLFILCLAIGSVDIPLRQVVNALTGSQVAKESWRIIVIEARLPMACTALLSGAALAVAGLLLQTTFDNPLAGPSILGISTGASLGVAVVMLALGGSLAAGIGGYIAALIGAIAGAAAIMSVLLLFSTIVRDSVMLLIIGILIGYLASSAISLLNFYATQEGVHSYVIWGLGNFSSVTLDRLAIFAPIIIVFLGLSMLLVKPLNALLLGGRYAVSLGLNLRSTRNRLLVISGTLTAVVTAFCGPIGFIGLVVPHISRLALRSSNHTVLLPSTALAGAAIGLLCTLISVLPGKGILPINAITPVIGVPVVIYVILRRKRLVYFN
ncbi:MAG: iron ABC transporter permease [Pseudoflavonifractor sp.]|nr:iron ABC transporter permease [Pseudoflavonifractor sp.]